MAGAAIKEIKAQLQQQGGQGQVWVDKWNERFSQLGSLREFLESRKDLKVIPGVGKKFTVAIAGASGSQVKAKPKSSPTGAATKGKGKATPGQLAIAPIPAWRGAKKGNGKGSGWDPKVAAAISEIKAQLTAQGGVGKVWIDNWRERFGEFGELRDFIRSRPDKFDWIPTGGKTFMVAFAGMAAAAPQPQSWKASAAPQARPAQKQTPAQKPKSNSAADAVREIKEQLIKQGGSGKIWVDNWKSRFGSLADSPRDFAEMRSEFEVVLGDGNKFTVKLADKNGGAGVKRKMPWEGTPSSPAAKKTKTGSSDSLEKEAIDEITKQLKKQKTSEGKIWIKNWNSKFKDSQGTLKEFLEKHDDKFVVNVDLGDSNKYTVTLLTA